MAVIVNWDMELFYSTSKSARARKFKSPEIGRVTDPATFVDAKDRIFAWFLPEILSPVDQVGSSLCYFVRGILTAVEFDFRLH
jgi:hypothetical protein